MCLTTVGADLFRGLRILRLTSVLSSSRGYTDGRGANTLYIISIGRAADIFLLSFPIVTRRATET
jgi:hypothetical protein